MEQKQVGYEEYEPEDIDVKFLESWQVDSMIREIKENNATIAKYKEIKDKHIFDLKTQFNNKKSQLEKQNSYMLTTLGIYAKEQKDLKSTKTQYKYESLQGDVIIKKAVPKNNVPPKENHEKIKESFPELIEVVESTKLAGWTDFKKNLVIQDEKVYNKVTGEELTDLFPITTNEEEVIVK